MTKKERQKILNAIAFFLDDNPDEWTNGMDELYMLVYGETWSGKLRTGKQISVGEFIELAKAMEGKNA